MKKHSIDLKVTMETIARQKGKLHEELIKCVSFLRNDKTYETTAIRNSRISEVIKLFTGITTNVYITSGDMMSAMFPMLSGSHSLVSVNVGYDSARVMSGLTELGEIKGGIDPIKGMVTGEFSKLKTQIRIGVENLESTIYTDEEIAAVIIHEIGHLFTYFQYLSTVVVGPSILAIAANALLMETDRKKREIILKTTGEKLGLDKTFYKEDYISNPKPGIDVMMLNDYLSLLPIGTLEIFYNQRLSEQMADTFTVKHCGARFIASYLSKHRRHNNWQRDSFFSHLLSEIGFLFKLFRVHKTGLISILFNTYMPEKYDRPNDRFEYMKLMLIDELKTVPTSDKELRDRILFEIENIDEISKEFVYRRDVVTFFWDILGKGRQYLKSTQREKALERMVYNELFYKATQLKQLADK